MKPRQQLQSKILRAEQCGLREQGISPVKKNLRRNNMRKMIALALALVFSATMAFAAETAAVTPVAKAPAAKTVKVKKHKGKKAVKPAATPVAAVTK